MQIMQVGLSHKTAPIEIREQLALSETSLTAALRGLLPEGNGNCGAILEGAILSTCNRLEVYAVVRDARQGRRYIRDYLTEITRVPGTVFDPHLQVRQGEASVAHLCEVACTLDSMILGESQIQGQVAAAHQLALRHGSAGAVLDAVFRTALRAGKRARSETAIARHAVSISHAAVELARQIFDNLAQKSVLLIGAGEMAELAAKSLVEHGVGNLVVVNRSARRAANLAKQFGGETLGWNRLTRALWRADIVISSTSAPQTILQPDMVSTAMHVRRNRFLFIIDIAVPRDVDPAVGELSNVFLYDIDDLQQFVGANLEQRKREIPRVRSIVDQEIAAFMAWFRARHVIPTIVDLRNHMEYIRDEEVRWAMSKLSHLSDEEQNVILGLTQRIVNKILHQPTVILKEHAGSDEAHRYIATLRNLFGLRTGTARPDEEVSND